MKQVLCKTESPARPVTIACFVSGSGTNYREIVKENPEQRYVVFTNRPGCGGTAIARELGHTVIEISHIPYLKEARLKYKPNPIPRNCPERVVFEQEVCRLLEQTIGGTPDLICLAGYDQWLTDWMVDRYYPRILNVHPGDTTKGYDGLYWIPSAKAILSGDKALRSTLFFVDRGEDTGPVLMQSAPMGIDDTILRLETEGEKGLPKAYAQVKNFQQESGVSSWEKFRVDADEAMMEAMRCVCEHLQDALKVAGDWQVYPRAVRYLVDGRIAVQEREVYLDGSLLPEYGFRLG